MDVFEALEALHKETAVDTLRRPLVSSETKNGSATNTRRSKTREVSSRYKSPTPVPSTTTKSRRCPSPNITNGRNINVLSTQLGSAKRAASAERKRPSTPPSPSQPTTPVSDTSIESLSSSKKMTGSRLPEVLWPSTMRSLSVSFQSDSISIPGSKKDKPVSHSASDRTLKPSSNVAHRQAETVSGPRKSTPERKRSPLKSKNQTHQSENSRPVDGSQARLIDQHRWPSRAGGKLSGSMLTKSIDVSNNNGIPLLRRLSADGIPRHLQRISGDASLRRLSADGISRHLQKTFNDASHQSEFEEHIGALGLRMKSVDDSLLRMSGLQKEHSLSSSEKASFANVSVRSKLVPGSRVPSPSRATVSKGTPSPSKTRPSTQIVSRGTSPSRVRQSSPTRQSSSTASVLSFIADIKKGKKINQLEDAHQLRLLYNRQLQWRFANARADAALFIQKITTEETLYNVWETNLELWDSVLRKRIELQRHNLDLKLYLVLREQMAQLEDWALLEEDHSSSLDGAINDLEASTLRLPVTGGAKADIDSLKAAISSAADVMQMMGSSICSLLSKEEIHELLLSFAEAGANVVRLKGGDPLIFGRGGEEMDFLQQKGIQVKVVPGITATSGIAAELGIPLTHRGIANSVRYLTGHSRKGGSDPLFVAENAADPDSTLVVYMGLSTLPSLAQKLMQHGLPTNTPAVAVERGTTPQQRMVFAELKDLAEKIGCAGLVSPTLIIIGKVVTLSPLCTLSSYEVTKLLEAK